MACRRRFAPAPVPRRGGQNTPEGLVVLSGQRFRFDHEIAEIHMASFIPAYSQSTSHIFAPSWMKFSHIGSQ